MFTIHALSAGIASSFSPRSRRLAAAALTLALPSIAAAVDVDVEWDAVPDERVAFYEVHWGTERGNYQWSQTSASTTATLPGLSAGQAHFIAVRGCTEDGALCSAYSEEIATTPSAPAPVADFLVTDAAGVAPHTTTFTSVSSGAISSYSWDFGDGSSSSAATAVHTYANAGTYSVRLTVSGPGGETMATKTDLVVVSPAPQAPPAPTPGSGTDGSGDALALEAGEARVDHQWQRVEFGRTFSDPVVVLKPLSGNDDDPATVRVDAVDSEGFWVRAQEWEYLDDAHAEESVGYLVIERGIHVLADGSRIEADVLELDGDDGFARVGFAAAFEQVPVLISSIISANDAGAVITRSRNVDLSGFELRLQTEQAQSIAHAAERVAFIAWEPSSGYIDERPFEVGRTKNKVKHLPYRIDFAAAFEEAPVLIADMQTTDGRDVGNVRWRDKGTDAVEVWIDEEQSLDSEVLHTTEVVGYILLEQTPPPPVEAPLESGVISVGSAWQTVSFAHSFTDPVVIAKVVSRNDPDPVLVRIDAVRADGFDIRLQEWDYQDDLHAPETVTYLVAERGHQQLPDGTHFEAGHIETDATNRLQAAAFQDAFAAAPVVLTTVSSFADPQAVTTRMDAIDASGFDIALEEENAGDQVHQPELIAYIAIELGTITWQGLHLEVERTANKVTEASHTLVYATAGAPVLFADMQSHNGGDTAALRIASVGTDSAELWVEEEQSYDDELRHTKEVVGYVLVRNADELLP